MAYLPVGRQRRNRKSPRWRRRIFTKPDCPNRSTKILKGFSDLARLNSKISLNIALPIHLLVLKNTLTQIPVLKKEIEPLISKIIKKIYTDLDPLQIIVESIERAISDDALQQSQ